MRSEFSNTVDWPKAAKLLSDATGAGWIHFRVESFLSSPNCTCVLVACSGGADSVFMLCQLWAQRDALGIELVVAHYNHRWRGEESLAQYPDPGQGVMVARQVQMH